MTGKHIQIRVCFGHHKKYTSGAIWNNGLVKWDPQNGLLYILHFLFLISHYHLLTELSFYLSAQIYDIFLDLILMDDIDFPVAGKQVPDVFIYLALEGNALPYCFAFEFDLFSVVTLCFLKNSWYVAKALEKIV